MANNQTLRPQSSAPSPSPSTVAVYADSNNVLVTITSGAAPVAVGTVVTGVIPHSAIRTGMATYLVTGQVFGTQNGAILQTGLGTPSLFYGVTVNGTGYGVPLFALKP